MEEKRIPGESLSLDDDNGDRVVDDDHFFH